MATVMNDRDVLLLGTAQRSTNPQGATILITADNPAFHVNSSNVTTPSYITFTAHLLGITGTASFTASGATITDNHDNTATIAYNGMSGASATVTATATVNGQTYSASTSVAKITDGTAGGTGPAGDQHAIAYLYQWNVTTPAKPTGTTVYTWANSTNSTYTDSDNWSVTVPSNPGTPGLSLYVAAMPISASGGTTTTSVSYTSSTVQAWTTNGAQGPQGNAGMQSATINVYQWAASIPAGPSGTSTYTWNGGAIGTVPSGWSATPGTAASQGMTLWAARIYLTDSATNSQTSFNWTSAAVVAVGYSGNNGAAGTAGASYVTAYCASTTATTTTAPAQTTGKTSLPATNDGGIVGTWSSTVPSLTSGQYLYQTDGIYDPQTNKVTWSVPYWSSLKVGSLSAITTNTGTLNVSGPISSANGKFSVDANGNVIMQSASMQDGNGNVILQVGTPLADAYVPVSAQNSQLTPIINAGAVKGAALNDDPNILNLGAWTLSPNISLGTGAGGSAVTKNYLQCLNGVEQFATQTRRFAVDPNKTYSLTAMLFASNGNARSMYLFVNFYDVNGNKLTGTGWGGTMSGYTFGGLPTPTGDWHRQGGSFGAGTSQAIPVATKEAEIGVWFQYSVGTATNVNQAAQDIRIEDITVAYKAQTDATSALNQLVNIASDNVLSRNEKPSANASWNTIYNERGGIVTQASNLGVDSTDYTNKFNTLQTYIGSLGSAFNDYTVDTAIVGTTFSTNFTNYYGAKQALINAMAAKASTLSTWAGVSGTGKPADNASSDLVLVGRGAVVIGNTAVKNSGTTAWDCDVYSKDSFTGGAFASVVVADTTTSYFLFGLNSDPTTDSSYISLDYAILLTSSGGCFIYESGTQIGSNYGAFAIGDVFAVIYDGSSVRYLKNGTVFYTSTSAASKAANQVLFFDSALNNNSSTMSNIRFGPMSSNNWASIGGANKPQDNATNGATLGVNVSGTVTNAKDIAQNIGTFVTSGTARTQISDTGIQVYDSSNNLRIKIGQL